MCSTVTSHPTLPVFLRYSKTSTTLQPCRSSRASYGGPKTAGELFLERNRANQRLFLDTADVSVWEQFLPTGALYGVTTNPLLLERANVDCTLESLSDLANEAFSLGAEEVQLQTWGASAESFLRTGLQLANIDPRIVVKIPLTPEGLEAANQLVRRGVRVTMTGLYNSHQVMMAAAVGCEYAAPYLGRMNAKKLDGESEIVQMRSIVSGMDSSLRVLVASIKTVKQVTNLAAKGITDFALPPEIFSDMLFNDCTINAALDFERAARAMGAEAADLVE